MTPKASTQRKNMMWNLPAPPGFQGLRDDLPLTCYEGLLPHWRQDGATYFVTFRLGDSLPASKLRELRAFKAEWRRLHPPPRSESDLEGFAREAMMRIERWLDQGMGSCLLRSKDASAQVVSSLHEEDGRQHELGSYIIMPNHVHAVVRPLVPTVTPLETILKRWKGISAKRINESEHADGSLWQRESFDRIIRDEEHLYRVIQYIASNPRKAGLSAEDLVRWIRPDWAKLGWAFESQ